MRLAMMITLVALCGCRSLLDADEFDVAQESRLPSKPAPGATPFYDEACLSCAATKCASESASCEQDLDCRTQLECSLPCTTPDCLVTCWLPYGIHPTPIHTIDDCMFKSCAEECRRGTNFECTGDWGWPRLYPGGQHPPNATVEIDEGFTHTLERLPLPDLRVRTSGVEGTTDAAGRIRMTVPLGLTGHTDALRIDDPTGQDRIVPTVIHRGDPRQEDFVYPSWELLSADDISGVLALLESEPYDPERAYLSVRLWDCQRDSPPGLSLTVDSADGRTVVSYLDGGFPTTDLTETTRNALVLVAHVPPGLARITATHVDSGQKTHELITVLSPGEALVVRLWPLTTAEAD